MKPVKFTKLRTEATAFHSYESALSAMARCALPAEFVPVREFKVQPSDGGWRASVTNRHGFMMFVQSGTPPCGHAEPESDYRDPETGAHRTARCEGDGRLVVRGTGHDSVTDGHMFISARKCPKCGEL